MTTADLGHDSFETDGGEFIVKHSTPKFPIFCRPSDDTIPENEAEERTEQQTVYTRPSEQWDIPLEAVRRKSTTNGTGEEL